MKLELPKRSDITDNSLDILKKQITYILPEYEEKYHFYQSALTCAISSF